ncbi:hypothetical protein CLOM_g22343, partial [Closterium sp. NIES-68]
LVAFPSTQEVQLSSFSVSSVTFTPTAMFFLINSLMRVCPACPSLRCSRLTSTGVTVAALGGACCLSSLMGVFSSMVRSSSLAVFPSSGSARYVDLAPSFCFSCSFISYSPCLRAPSASTFQSGPNTHRRPLSL